MTHWPLLSILIWLPILGGVCTLLAGNARPGAARWIALGFAVAEARNAEEIVDVLRRDLDAPDMAAANAVQLASGKTVGDTVAELAAKIGEKLEVANAASYDGDVTIYLHKRSSDLPPQVGVMVEYDGGDEDFVRGIAMQIAAMSPRWKTVWACLFLCGTNGA